MGLPNSHLQVVPILRGLSGYVVGRQNQRNPKELISNAGISDTGILG
jgi:hypothetical protein